MTVVSKIHTNRVLVLWLKTYLWVSAKAERRLVGGSRAVSVCELSNGWLLIHYNAPHLE